MKEQWKTIDGYRGLYKISNKGEIKSLISNTILKPCIVNGYERVNLYKKSEIKQFKVHRLVAIAFIPNPENKPCIDHINGDRVDNRVENLRWVTHKENANNLITKARTYHKSVICIETDIIYYSANEAQKFTGIPFTEILRACKN